MMTSKRERQEKILPPYPIPPPLASFYFLCKSINNLKKKKKTPTVYKNPKCVTERHKEIAKYKVSEKGRASMPPAEGGEPERTLTFSFSKERAPDDQ